MYLWKIEKYISCWQYIVNYIIDPFFVSQEGVLKKVQHSSMLCDERLFVCEMATSEREGGRLSNTFMMVESSSSGKSVISKPPFGIVK